MDNEKSRKSPPKNSLLMRAANAPTERLSLRFFPRGHDPNPIDATADRSLRIVQAVKECAEETRRKYSGVQFPDERIPRWRWFRDYIRKIDNPSKPKSEEDDK